MNISIFVTIWMATASTADLNSHFLDEPLSYLKSNSHINAVEFYTAEPGDVPRMDDIPMPSLLVEIRLNSDEQAKALTQAEEFKKLFVNKDGLLAEADKINLDVLEAVHYNIPGHESPPPRTAPFTFVVRYYGPVENAADFTDFYTTNHPPLLAQFPNIRNVLCYLPLGWREQGAITDASLIHGNEVVFDSLEDFKTAIKSKQMDAVMADSDLFKPFGYSSHHAMHRELVFQR